MLEINILTLNVWAIPIPFVSSDRKERIAAIGTELNSGRYDIVSLQEVWSQADCETLKSKTASILPYSHYFYSGVIGAGLLVLSKYPIIGSLFHSWSVNGYFHRIQHADWFGGKGVGLCRILINNNVIHLYNAHLHAEYDKENDEYKTHRVLQAFDTAQFIRATRGDAVLQVLAGDLNTKPYDLTYKVLLYISKMSDCCLSENIATHEFNKNSYTSKYALLKNPDGIRIDHIFVRSSELMDVTVADYILPFPNRVPGQKFSFSDHEAVLTKLKLNERQTPQFVGEKCSYINGATNTSNKRILDEHFHNINYEENSISKRMSILHDSISLCELSLQQLKIDRIIYYGTAIFFILLLIAFVEYSVPNGFKTVFLLFKIIVFGIVIFCIFMGSIWNYIERNGILCGKVSMEVMLKCIEYFEIGQQP